MAHDTLSVLEQPMLSLGPALSPPNVIFLDVMSFSISDCQIAVSVELFLVTTSLHPVIGYRSSNVSGYHSTQCLLSTSPLKAISLYLQCTHVCIPSSLCLYLSVHQHMLPGETESHFRTMEFKPICATFEILQYIS